MSSQPQKDMYTHAHTPNVQLVLPLWVSPTFQLWPMYFGSESMAVVSLIMRFQALVFWTYASLATITTPEPHNQYVCMFWVSVSVMDVFHAIRVHNQSLPSSDFFAYQCARFIETEYSKLNLFFSEIFDKRHNFLFVVELCVIKASC